jgi:hypothetical protein
MKLKFVIVASVLYVVAFCFFLKAKTLFDSAWLIAIFTIPASLIADFISRLLASSFGNDHKNIFVDLVLLFIFGLAQYALLAYILGWAIDRFLKMLKPSKHA